DHRSEETFPGYLERYTHTNTHTPPWYGLRSRTNNRCQPHTPSVHTVPAPNLWRTQSYFSGFPPHSLPSLCYEEKKTKLLIHGWNDGSRSVGLTPVGTLSSVETQIFWPADCF